MLTFAAFNLCDADRDKNRELSEHFNELVELIVICLNRLRIASFHSQSCRYVKTLILDWKYYDTVRRNMV